MTIATPINTIDRFRPDDILLVSASFEEERCIAGVDCLENYSAKCSIVLNFESASNPRGERKKNRSARALIERLSRVDLSGAPRHITVSGVDTIGLIRELRAEVRGRGMELRNLNITVDISCLTKIQLVAIMRFFFGVMISNRLRLIYSYPREYNTSGWDRFTKLYSGFSKPIFLPIQGMVLRSNQIEKRLAVVLAGHEGERTFSAWRNAESDSTWLVEGVSDNVRVMEACRLENQYIYEYVQRPSGGHRKFSFGSLDYVGVREALSAALKSQDPRTTQVYVIPFGPKPLLVGLIAGIFDTQELRAQLIYPATSTYNSEYSSGVAGISVYEIK